MSINFPDWPAKKSTYPFGAVPVWEEPGKGSAKVFGLTTNLSQPRFLSPTPSCVMSANKRSSILPICGRLRKLMLSLMRLRRSPALWAHLSENKTRRRSWRWGLFSLLPLSPTGSRNLTAIWPSWAILTLLALPSLSLTWRLVLRLSCD